jgi:carboxyl-terminal processing protease
MQLITEMVKSLGDKYTRVLDVQAYAAIQKFDLIGVGVTLMPNAQKEIIVGAPPIAGSPSEKAGLSSGDFVTAVNGVETKGRTAFDIIDQISESPNAKTVTFTMRRQRENDLSGEGVKFDVTLERQNSQVKDPVQYKLSEQRKDGTVVGYVRVLEFNSQVNSKLQGALDDLKKQGANAYVLDLRSNTGGAFQSAIEVSGYFYENRVATYVLDSNGVELPFRAPKGKLSVDPSSPLVVWIDGMSASASEVLAGSLHDNCRAVTMGDKSFGKGLIQAVYGLKNGAGLVLTVAKYVTPSGTEIQGIGITPDISGNMPAPVLIPVLSSDTSKIDFKDIARRLDSSYCKVPEEHGKTVPVPVEAIKES